MSLYNALFGRNPNSDLLHKLIDLDDGKFDIPRHRDTYIEKTDDGKLVVCVFTRTGGGNNECYCDKEFENEEQHVASGCYRAMNERLSEHPLYVSAADDDYDYTYRTFRFRVSDSVQEEIAALLDTQPDEGKPMERFQQLLTKLQSKDQNDPDVQRALAVGKEIFGQLKTE